MSEFLYITADAIGTETGGGAVTWNESEALRSLGEVQVLSYPDAPRPWGADEAAAHYLQTCAALRPRLAHFYSGTFTKTIEILKARGCKVTYTAAAHSINISREEHEKLGLPFDYPHLTDPILWEKYVRGYLLADMVVCPSTLSAEIMRGYGCKNVVVIPHGVSLPAEMKPLPKRFSVAAMGAGGPDKGLIYLLQAWKMLDYRNATLTIAGHGSEHLLPMVRQYGGGNVYLRGWVENVSDVYNTCSVFVQPSASEGYGIEVLEAMAHDRIVICSNGAGAADIAKVIVPSRSSESIVEAIDVYRREPKKLIADGIGGRAIAEAYAWTLIQRRYVDLWETIT